MFTLFAGSPAEIHAQQNESRSLEEGKRYWFDLTGNPAMEGLGIEIHIPASPPDDTKHWVPFLYTGTVDAYKLDTERVITEEEAEGERYAHSLFVSEFPAANFVSWEELDGRGLIFGTDYTSGGLAYEIRTMSVGSDRNLTVQPTHGIPKSNEWDVVLDKGIQIPNWSALFSWGQDTYAQNGENRALRGYYGQYNWDMSAAATEASYISYRPVLEFTGGTSEAGSREIAVDLNGGTIGTSEITGEVYIVAKRQENFQAPASEGLTPPEGGEFLYWMTPDGGTYLPGEEIPKETDRLKAVWREYTVTMVFEDGSGREETALTVGGKLEKLPEPSRDGYLFEGWHTAEGEEITEATVFTEDTVIYAGWKKEETVPPVQKYTLSFDTDGGTPLADITGEEGARIALAKYRPERAGYQFIGWYLDRGKSERIEEVILDGNRTVYAGWEAVQEETAGGDAGSGAVQKQTGSRERAPETGDRSMKEIAAALLLGLAATGSILYKMKKRK